MHDASVESGPEAESDPPDLGSRGYVVASAFALMAVLLEVVWVAALAYGLIAGVRAAGL